MTQERVVESSFTGTGTSNEFKPCTGTSKTEEAHFNVSVWGTFSGTAQLQRSFDGGSTWIKVADYTAESSEIKEECEDIVLYRFECTSYSSGTINYRLSQ